MYVHRWSGIFSSFIQRRVSCPRPTISPPPMVGDFEGMQRIVRVPFSSVVQQITSCYNRLLMDGLSLDEKIERDCCPGYGSLHPSCSYKKAHGQPTKARERATLFGFARAGERKNETASSNTGAENPERSGFSGWLESTGQFTIATHHTITPLYGTLCRQSYHTAITAAVGCFICFLLWSVECLKQRVRSVVTAAVSGRHATQTAARSRALLGGHDDSAN